MPSERPCSSDYADYGMGCDGNQPVPLGIATVGPSRGYYCTGCGKKIGNWIGKSISPALPQLTEQEKDAIDERHWAACQLAQRGRVPEVDYRLEEYRKSPEWAALSSACLKRDGCCRVCKSKVQLRAHHVDYRNLRAGFEKELADLVCVCERCHSAIHDLNPWQRAAQGKHAVFPRDHNYERLEQILKKCCSSQMP